MTRICVPFMEKSELKITMWNPEFVVICTKLPKIGVYLYMLAISKFFQNSQPKLTLYLWSTFHVGKIPCRCDFEMLAF